MKKILIWIMVAVFVVSLSFIGAGCAQAAEETTAAAEETTAAAEEQKVVAFLLCGIETPYCPPYLEAMKAGVEAAGYKFVYWEAAFDVPTQVDQFNEAITINPDIIDCNALDSAAVGPTIKKAFDAGIPVLMDHSQAEPEDVPYTVAYVGSDNYTEGLKAGELINETLGGEGKMVIIEGAPGMEAQITRTQGLEDKLAELGSNIEILAKQTANWVKADATAVMEDFLVRYPDIDCVYAQDDTMAVGAWVAIEEAGIPPGEIKIVGIGASSEGLNAIKDGIMVGTIGQIPTDGGVKSAEIIDKILTQGIKPPDQLDPYLNFMDHPIITIDNVEEYLPGVW
jgi:ribose transport system substrate-binding protein